MLDQINVTQKVDILAVLKAMRAAETAMRVCVLAHTHNIPLEWRGTELSLARADLSESISSIESILDEACRINPR